jgi:hypothetical protein
VRLPRVRLGRRPLIAVPIRVIPRRVIPQRGGPPRARVAPVRVRRRSPVLRSLAPQAAVRPRRAPHSVRALAMGQLPRALRARRPLIAVPTRGIRPREGVPRAPLPAEQAGMAGAVTARQAAQVVLDPRVTSRLRVRPVPARQARVVARRADRETAGQPAAPAPTLATASRRGAAVERTARPNRRCPTRWIWPCWIVRSVPNCVR